MPEYDGSTPNTSYSMNLPKHIILGIWGMLLPALSTGQNVLYEQFTTADGLPSMTTYEMVQDSNGILWIGTEDGLVSYDGVEFTTYTHPELKDNDIISLALNRKGHILFLNLSNQLGRVSNDSIEILFEVEGRIVVVQSSTKADYVYTKGTTGNIYHAILYQVENDSLHTICGLLKQIPQRELIIEEKIYYNTAHPINRLYYILKNDSLVFLKHEENLSCNKEYFLDFSFDEKNTDILHTNYAKLEDKYIGLLSTAQAFYLDPWIVKNYASSTLERVVSFGSDFYIISKKSLEYFNGDSRLLTTLINNKVINTVFEDRERSLWVSTRGNGLLRIKSKELQIKSFSDKSEIITSIHSTKNHIFCIWGDLIEAYNQNFKKELRVDFETEKSSAAFANENDLYALNKGKVYQINADKNKTNNNELNILIANAIVLKDSIMHIATMSSIHHLLNQSFPRGLELKHLGNEKNIALQNIKCMIYAKSNDILLAGSPNGLFELKSDFSYSSYGTDLKDTHVIDIEEAVDSTIWVASKNNGIYHLKNKKVIFHYNTESGLISNSINDIEVQNEFVYVASKRGITQINSITGDLVNKNSTNGLPQDNVTNLCIFQDSIWMTLHNDLVSVAPTFFNNRNIPPIIYLKAIEMNDKTINFVDNMIFSHDENNINIYFKNISLSSENKYIEYKVANLENSWVRSTEATIRLPSLQPGKYIIEARGVNNVGVKSEILTVPFTIKSPWYNTLWAKILILIGLVSLSFVIILYRSRRIRKQEAVKRDYLNQINAVKDKALQLQMNPHFIFNSLNAIQGFIGTADEEKALNYLARFARLIRLIFEYSKGDSISLEEELEFIKLYLDLEKLRFKDKVDINLSIDPKLVDLKDMVRVPSLLIQPIIENSFKHGLFHKKGKGLLFVNYTMESDKLKVTIEDNGIGRAASKNITAYNNEKQTSSGIKNTEERIQLLNHGQASDKSKIMIEDLFDKNGQARGTRTTIQLPLS